MAGVKAFFTEAPRLSRTLAVLLVVLTLLGMISSSIADALTLVPGNWLGRFQVWNVFTGGLYEPSLLVVFVDIGVLLVAGRLLEPSWGSREFLFVLCVVNLVTGVCTWAIFTALYAFTFKGGYLYARFCGFSGLMGALLVAVKQSKPEAKIGVLPIKYLPSLFFVLHILLWYVMSSNRVVFATFGLATSWIYLRFLQRRGEQQGDLSDAFSFSSFFPDACLPVTRPIANLVFMVLASCGFFRKARAAIDSHPSDTLSRTPALPGSDPVAAERRRLRAMKALEQRLASMSASSAGPHKPAPPPPPPSSTSTNPKPDDGDKSSHYDLENPPMMDPQKEATATPVVPLAPHPKDSGEHKHE